MFFVCFTGLILQRIPVGVELPPVYTFYFDISHFCDQVIVYRYLGKLEDVVIL